MSEITSPAAAVMHFVDVLIGARLSGFVETSTPTLVQVFQCARNHVMDNYGTHTSLLGDVVSAEEFAVLSEVNEPDGVSNKKIELHGDIEWRDCEKVAEHQDVHECPLNLSLNPTGDNGIEVVRAVLNCTDRETDYEYVRNEGIDYLISALGVDVDGDEAEPHLLVKFLKDFTDSFIKPNCISWVDDDEKPGYSINKPDF